MSARSVIAIRAAFAAAGFALFALSANAATHRCASVVRAELAKAGIVDADVRTIRITQQRRQIRDNYRVVGFDGYVKFESCPGTFVVNMRTDCGPRTVYTTGMCSFEGVPSYQD